METRSKAGGGWPRGRRWTEMGGGEWGRLNQQQGIIVSIEILKLMLL